MFLFYDPSSQFLDIIFTYKSTKVNIPFHIVSKSRKLEKLKCPSIGNRINIGTLHNGISYSGLK